MKLGLVLVLLSLGACSGESFVSEAVTVAPDAGHIDDAPALPAVDGADRTEAPPATPDVVGPGEAARDVLADPWPDDVEVVAVDAPPCINCYVFKNPDGSWNHVACCDGSGNPSDAATDHLCTQGDFPTPYKAYCASCSCR